MSVYIHRAIDSAYESYLKEKLEKQKKRKRKITVGIIFLLIVLTIFVVPYIISLQIGARVKLQKEVEVFFNYDDTNIFGADMPIDGLNWTIYDSLDTLLAYGTTGSDGLATTNLFTYSGTLRIEYLWQSVDELSVLSIGLNEIELTPFEFNASLYWEFDLSPIEIGTIIPIAFNSIWFMDYTVSNEGNFYLEGVPYGTYTLGETELVIPVSASLIYMTDIFVSTERV